jgi:hypothetical protein
VAAPPRLSFLRLLDPATLRGLASLIEDRGPQRRPLRDPEASAQALAEMLEQGATPTIGWWRRQFAPTEDR